MGYSPWGHEESDTTSRSVSSAEAEKPCLKVITVSLIFMRNTVSAPSFTVHTVHFYYLKTYRWIEYFPTKGIGWKLEVFDKIPDISLFPYS